MSRVKREWCDERRPATNAQDFVPLVADISVPRVFFDFFRNGFLAARFRRLFDNQSNLRAQDFLDPVVPIFVGIVGI